jgi:AbrB family looped-hinge helix DNA binding protein
MPQTTISARFQIVIPKEIRDEVPLAVGQALQVIAKNGVIILVPDRPLSTLRGFARGMSTDGFREKSDRSKARS